MPGAYRSGKNPSVPSSARRHGHGEGDHRVERRADARVRRVADDMDDAAEKAVKIADIVRQAREIGVRVTIDIPEPTNLSRSFEMPL